MHEKIVWCIISKNVRYDTKNDVMLPTISNDAINSLQNKGFLIFQVNSLQDVSVSMRALTTEVVKLKERLQDGEEKTALAIEGLKRDLKDINKKIERHDEVRKYSAIPYLYHLKHQVLIAIVFPPHAPVFFAYQA